MIKGILKIALLLFVLSACKQQQQKETTTAISNHKVSLIVLGTIQDAGSPHIACKKECCTHLFEKPDKDRQVVSLGVIDSENKATYLFEATPDITAQLKTLKNSANFRAGETPNGVFLTHAHIGHYTGLMYLGKEAMNAKSSPVYAMPKMKTFLENNGPWSQLVATKNIAVIETQHQTEIKLSSNLTVVPFVVPHRDEFSETVGYTIVGPNKSALFVPDIDKWEKWDKDIIAEISKVDYAFIDATFFDGEEINNRDISAIPHPFIIESMQLFSELSAEEKAKIIFIHFNHTNPALNLDHPKAQLILENGFNIAQIHDIYDL